MICPRELIPNVRFRVLHPDDSEPFHGLHLHIWRHNARRAVDMPQRLNQLAEPFVRPLYLSRQLRPFSDQVVTMESVIWEVFQKQAAPARDGLAPPPPRIEAPLRSALTRT